MKRKIILIEDILQRAFQNERLKRQPPAFDIDFYEALNKWSKSKNKTNSKPKN